MKSLSPSSSCIEEACGLNGRLHESSKMEVGVKSSFRKVERLVEERSLADGKCSSRKNSFRRVRFRVFSNSRRGDNSKTSTSKNLSNLWIIDDSHGTVDIDISHPLSCTNWEEEEATGGAVCGRPGCLKIQTQAQSLAYPYRSAVVTETTTMKDTTAKLVRFGDMEIHNHAIILGDNPAVSRGPPIAIGWDVLYTDRISVDEYERYRPERRPPRHFSMPKAERERLLMEFGYARSDLKAGEEEIRAIQKSRQENSKSGAMNSITCLMGRHRSQLENVQVD
jgi:hypothetical protein